MKITLESSTEIAIINGAIPATIWHGHTASGIAIDVCMVAMKPAQRQDSDRLDAELRSLPQPTSVTTIYVINPEASNGTDHTTH